MSRVYKTTINSALARLRALESTTYRKDFREAAQAARRVIESLSSRRTPKEARDMLAQHISERAAAGRVIVYRTQKTGEIRTLAASAKSASRIPPSQWIGTYDHGADWRQIAEDIA